MTRMTSKSWTEDDIARLAQLSNDGATVIRAAAALNRKMSSVKIFARRHGLPLIEIRQAKRNARNVCSDQPV